MQVGVNLPSEHPGADGPLLLEWARRADAGPFSTLGVTDRIAWATFEPFATLAAAAAVTRRIRLMTTIAIAPLRSAALLAKSAATVDAISGGRFTLGLGLGPREDDYARSRLDFRGRGRKLDEMLEELRPTFEDDAIGPKCARAGGPEILIGGGSDHTFARMARYADGYIHGGGPAKAFARSAEKALAAWADAGRPGRPRLLGHAYYALGGEETVERGTRALARYYSFLGPFSERIADGILSTPHAIAQAVRSYADVGCEELLLFPTVPEIDQLTRLEDVVGTFHLGAEAPERVSA